MVKPARNAGAVFPGVPCYDRIKEMIPYTTSYCFSSKELNDAAAMRSFANASLSLRVAQDDMIVAQF